MASFGPVGFACPFVDAPPPKLQYPMPTTQALPVVLPVSDSGEDGPLSAATDRTKAMHVSSSGTHPPPAVGSAANGDVRHRSYQHRGLHISVSPQMESLPNGSASFVSTLSDDIDEPPTTVLASALPRFCTVHDAVAPPPFHARGDVFEGLKPHDTALPPSGGFDGVQSSKKMMAQSEASVASATHWLSHDGTVFGVGASFVPLTSVASGVLSTTTVAHAASGIASANASRGAVGAPLFDSAATSPASSAMRGAPPAFFGSSKTAALLAAFKSSSVGPPHTHVPPSRATTAGGHDHTPALSRSYTKLFVGQVPPWANAKEWLAGLFEPYGVREIVVKNFSDRVGKE